MGGNLKSNNNTQNLYHMFKVNRKEASARYIDTEGNHVVAIHKIEETLDTKGREVVVVTFKTDDGASINDRFLNQENVWWRVNSLVAATNPDIPDDTEVDFANKRGSFAEFIAKMLGLKLEIVCKYEEYQKDGEAKKILRVKNMKPITHKSSADPDWDVSA